MVTTITKLADFIDGITFADLPANVVHETKRLLLDSLGCALAGVTSDKGKWGIEFSRKFFAGSPQATVLGLGDRMSAVGAAFVNGELINALDYDAAGKHLPPFVIPPSLATAEMNRVSGKELITACALALEVGMRIGLALGSYRDIKDDKTSLPPVTGHSSAVFGGAAGVAKLEGFSGDEVAQALGMAGLISPVQTQTPMHKDLPTNSGKYLMAGWASQAAITAPYLIKAGHRGDIVILDGDYGYWRFTGSTRWDPDWVVSGLGEEWRFVRKVPIKQYPCCRMMHGGLDCLAAILEENKLRPEEIDGIHAYLEATCVEPLFNNPNIANQIDAQFSVAYNMSVLAFGIKPGARWQDLDTMNDPQIRQFMKKVTFEPHPEYVDSLKKDANTRISKVEVAARGRTFVAERAFIKGTITADPATYITDDELMAKFKDNASRILPSRKVNEACSRLIDLDSADDVTKVIEMLHL
ncbi:MmgE/PrpD family protein [Desulfosporosinus sp. PR]|uniref:MmgE/PrpD family protein n=1 Tax=Candidatus Desulfosporosinus nitrosoreducens TaxID=3401928 RepID=UPI0027E66F26|nr:MmgE/PrpD family protein [Desulfosporosinus sp. PR]MDQ7096524.1 MmgE/PrpD family protein [Desulfosporosinus sp. PR]